MEIAGGYSQPGVQSESGERGSRYEHVEEILCRISGAESALVVNNNAGAVFLTLNSLAEGKEVIVSRGQLVEIGGSFRIPDVMRKSGARLVEVGTTNRTHLRDYEQAISGDTALLLKVHTSNFRILGFTAEVPIKDLIALGQSQERAGDGRPGERMLRRSVPIRNGKGANGPGSDRSRGGRSDLQRRQIAGGTSGRHHPGKEKGLDLLKKNPLTRALRIDKLTLAGLESTLREYLDRDQALKILPALSMLTCPLEELKGRAKQLQRKLIKGVSSSCCEITLREESSQVGGGALPLQALPTRVLALRPLRISAAILEERLRKSETPVIARVKEEEVLLDLRTVAEEEEEPLLEAVRQALKE